MSLRYDTEQGEFVADAEECGDCGAPLCDTGCDAPGCGGWCCVDCGTGCDALVDGGRCASVVAAESDEDRAARIDEERRAWGLGPAGGA